eukprot:4617980-Pleurochrysis_carterae.AAC.3
MIQRGEEASGWRQIRYFSESRQGRAHPAMGPLNSANGLNTREMQAAYPLLITAQRLLGPNLKSLRGQCCGS